MCLKRLNHIRPDFKDGKAKVYKLCVSLDGKRLSAYRFKNITAGIYKSDRTSAALTLQENSNVYSGIHVFIHQKDAEYLSQIYTECPYIGVSYVILECTAYEKDFVAGGYFDCWPSAVFTQITIGPESRTWKGWFKNLWRKYVSHSE